MIILRGRILKVIAETIKFILSSLYPVLTIARSTAALPCSRYNIIYQESCGFDCPVRCICQITLHYTAAKVEQGHLLEMNEDAVNKLKQKLYYSVFQRTPLDVLWIKWTILHERKDIYIFRCILHLYWRLHCMCVCVLAISYQLQIVPLFFTKHWEWGRNVFLLYQCLRGERSSCRKMSRTNSDGPHLKPCLFS